jgi:hypothetical protein
MTFSGQPGRDPNKEEWSPRVNLRVERSHDRRSNQVCRPSVPKNGRGRYSKGWRYWFEDHDDTFGESMDREATRGYVDTRDSAAETLHFLTTMTFAAELKKKLFLHLTDILLQVPESCDKFPDVSEFWMDGTGNMVQKVNFDTPK